jgi:predicted phage baseplate assembly protein
MPIQSPQLDDLRYDGVVQQLLRRIPVYSPEWTDWNDSDPGVTLIQLFSYLAEQVGYRLNQVPEKNYVELLKLLGIQLRPALAARSRIGIFLTDATLLEGFTLDARSRFMTKGSPAVIFESDAGVDLVPAEPAVLVTTRNPYLWDLLRLNDSGGRESAPAAVSSTACSSRGKTSKRSSATTVSNPSCTTGLPAPACGTCGPNSRLGTAWDRWERSPHSGSSSPFQVLHRYSCARRLLPPKSVFP